MTVDVVFHISVPIILALIINGIIYMNKWAISSNANPLIPPGWIVGVIWVILFALLGYAHYLTWFSATSMMIVVVLLYSLSYPFITRLKQRLIYDVIALILASILCIVGAYQYKNVVIYLVPLFIWASYVVAVGALRA